MIQAFSKPKKLKKNNKIINTSFINFKISNFKENSIEFDSCQMLYYNNIVFKSEFKNLHFKNCSIQTLNVDSFTIINNLQFTNCKIQALYVNGYILNLEFINCEVNTLYISNTSSCNILNSNIRFLTILKFCPTLHGSGFIIDHVNFENCKINTDCFSLAKRFLTTKFLKCEFLILRDFDFGRIIKLEPLHSIFLADWGKLPDELTSLCMAFDAQNHPEPDKFDYWANYGSCPYNNSPVNRMISFVQERYLWRPELLLTPINVFELINKLFKVKNITATWG